MLSQLVTALILLVTVAGFGLVIAAWASQQLELNAPAALSLVPLAGVAMIGSLTLVVGHLGALGDWLPYGLALVGVGTALVRRRDVARFLRRVSPSVVGQARAHWAQVTITATAFGLAAVAALAPPTRTDEIQYHWPAPLAWAEAGGWNDSPYRHVDAFPFMEIVYTAAAVQGSYVAAHLLHLTTLLAVGLAAAGVARSLDIRGSAPVAAAAMCMPVVWDGAYVAYNDTAAGAFAVGGAAVALGARRRPAGALLAAALLSVAVSIKPTAAVAAAAVGLLLLLQEHSRRMRWGAALRHVRRFWVTAGAAVLATLIFWSVRLHFYTGHWIDPAWTEEPDAYALTMLPTPLAQALAPLLPFVSGLIGAEEPWGARTALVVQLGLLPALVAAFVWRGQALRRFVTLTLPAWAHWTVLGLAIVRTRFHIFTWVLLVAGVRGALEAASERHPRWSKPLELGWTTAVALGAVDVSIDMVRTISTI